MCAGILTDQTQETLQNNALAVLIKIFGGALTMDVEEATHLVARQKPGWEKSGKIKRAMERQQVTAACHLPLHTRFACC